MSHDTAAKDREDGSETTGESVPGARDVLLAIGRHLWEQARDTHGRNWPPLWLVLAVAAAGVGVVLMLIVPVVRGLLFAAGDSIAALGGWAHEQAYAQIVLAPVRRYLDAHAEGLPIPTATLWWTWCITGMVLLAMCLLHVIAARIGWVLYGAATTAMVAAATPGSGRWIAAAVSGVWWVLLSIPAFGRHRAAPVLVLPAPPTGAVVLPPEPANAPAPARVDAASPPPESAPNDFAAWAAGLYERQVRRADHAPPADVAMSWTAVTTGPTSFTAHEGDRHVTGMVINGLAAEDLLRQLSTPAGARAAVRWTTNPPQTSRRRRISDEGYDGPPPLADFVRDSPTSLSAVTAALAEIRSRWSGLSLDEQITARADLLNRTAPLTPDDIDLIPDSDDDLSLGSIAFNDWIDLDTVIGGNVSSWNDFASHRPEVVGLIIEKLLAADDPDVAFTEILTDLGHACMLRYNGPAGPMHRIGRNGTHRTHALRILGLPIMAAEVEIEALPLRVDALSTWGEGNWGDSYDGPADRMWHALRDRGLLEGTISGSGPRAKLEPYRAAAPWLLGNPRTAAAVSAAYERIYPGGLGIPADAMSGPQQWIRWLLAT
ncbi:hypothetical protein [Micromonospora aurantiaca (nom. illeg.)]|uniref:hypothetical protein n=1 Tax=Micromonospora aurantiaca (nom. illeg.) TaxID=47850 RepID=UPI0033FB8A4D